MQNDGGGPDDEGEREREMRGGEREREEERKDGNGEYMITLQIMQPVIGKRDEFQL